MKKIINAVLVLFLLCSHSVSVFAEEEEDFILEEPTSETVEQTEEQSEIMLLSDVGTATVVETGSCTDTITYTYYDDGSLVFEGTGRLSDYNGSEAKSWFELLPTKVVFGEGITYIGSNILPYNGSVQTLVLPSSLEEIGVYAFYKWTNLRSLNIPANVTKIDSSALIDTISLETITVDPANTVYDSRNNCNALIKSAEHKLMKATMNTTIPSDIKVIGQYAFEGIYQMTGTLTIPEGVTVIEATAFHNCSNLEQIVLPSTLKEIHDDAFNYCSKVTSINLPEGLELIDRYVFANCSSLTSLNIPSSVRNIGVGAFIGMNACTSLTVASGNTMYDSRNNCNAIIETATNTLIGGCSTTVIPSTVVSINDYAFNRLTSLTSIVIPEGVETINRYVFEGCTNLTSVTLPNSLRTIGSWAFDRCEKLNTIKIPSGVTTINGYAFYHNVNTKLQVYAGTEGEAYAIREDINYELLADEKYPVVCQSSPLGSGILTGGGLYAAGATVSLTAAPVSGYRFIGWYDENGDLVSDSTTYSTTASNVETHYVARFVANESNQLTVSTGLGKVEYSYNDVSGTWYNDRVGSYSRGTDITVTAVPYPGFTFLYWVDSNRRILSEEVDYNFSLTTDRDIRAVYKTPNEGSYYVIFRNIRKFGNTIIQASDVHEGDSADEPDMRKYNYYGYHFDGWDQSFSKVTSDLVIHPIYSSIELYELILNGESEPYENGDLVKLHAPETNEEGKYFSGWFDEDDNLISALPDYSFYIQNNVILNSKYESDTPIEDRPIVFVQMGERTNNDDNTKQMMVSTVNYHVPEGYTVENVGIIRTFDSSKTDKLTLANVDGNIIKKNEGNKPESATGNYSLTLGLNYSSGAALKNVYHVGYIIYKTPAGEIVEQYTPVKVSVPCE